jgi:division protein CdvB (Snf7/Vps24/ESCRT-III family)
MEMGSQHSLSDNIKEEKKMLKRQERVIDREIALMEHEKQQCKLNIKKQVRNNMMINANIIAKNYTMIQSNITKLYKMKNQLSTLSLELQMMNNQQQIHIAMGKVATTIKMLNSKMNLQSVKGIIKEYESEKTKYEVTTDLIETLMENEDVDEETEDEILARVLDEIGVKLENEIAKPPSSMVYSSTANNVKNMEDRLNRISSHNF